MILNLESTLETFGKSYTEVISDYTSELQLAKNIATKFGVTVSVNFTEIDHFVSIKSDTDIDQLVAYSPFYERYFE